MKKAGIIGHFAFGQNKLNGQTVKTLAVARVLENEFGKEQVICEDTSGGLLAVPRMLKSCKKLCDECEHKVITLAQNGLKILLPRLYKLNGKTGKNMHLVAIGSWLPSYLKDKEKLLKTVKDFSGVYVETEKMAAELKKYGFSNVHVLPNFKPFERRVEFAKDYVSSPVRICTFSRIMPEKGIREAALGVKTANRKGELKYHLTVFGQVEKNFEEAFLQLLTEYKDCMSYGGEIAYNKCVDTLKEFDAMLFPTYYEGEGLAGTLLDAFAAGLPVIATDFKYNKQYVEPGENGLLVPARNAGAIASALTEMFEKCDVMRFRTESLKRADRYSARKSAEILLEKLR